MTTLLKSILTLIPSPFASSGLPNPPRRRLSDADDEDEDLKTLLNPATCSQKGKHWVWADEPEDTNTDERKGHEIYYELHGTGKEHVLFIMGLSNGSSSWSTQVDHFGSLSDYSVLVFDNRGSGHSGYPSGPYTTSAMAQDVVSLLDFVEWTGSKSIHLVGISMGGMISLELATLIPERLASLTLCVTSAGDKYRRNLPPREGLQTMMKLMFVTKKQEDRIDAAVELLYPANWLDEEDPDDSECRTRRITRTEHPKRFNDLLERTFREGREVSGPPGEPVRSDHLGMGIKLDGPAV
ncbi:Soluble epoxide hydrolase [Phaffia rhodozyma]|uniref:Soluble epoxide hydrolase n=1 Tax=Phaffia rhodozyma TaxID=264483 RepID=A0A0F7SNK3_PHARH|nr:Soluble epoxide hydrolase [Phaffia rhodozyma]